MASVPTATQAPVGAVNSVGAGEFEPLGSVDVPGARDAAVHHDGEIAYVAATDGFAVVDISDPGEPTLLAERREIETDTDQFLGRIWDVWPSGDRLVVAGPAQSSRQLPNGFALFDISDPETPTQVAFHPTEHHIHNTFFTDETVYLTGSGLDTYPLVIVDVSDDEPVEVGRWSIVDADAGWMNVPASRRLLHDVFVQDGIAYLLYWDAGTWLLDVSDPESPEPISSINPEPMETMQGLETEDFRRALLSSRIPPGNDHYGQVNEDGTVLAIGEEAWGLVDEDGLIGDEGELIGGPGTIALWDISTPEEPSYLSTIQAPPSRNQTRNGWFTSAHNFDIVGDRLYSSWYYGGIRIHDISDPANPTELSWWLDPRETTFWTAQVGVPGESVVASSANLRGLGPSGEDTREALYVFPDRTGSQVDRIDLSQWFSDVYGPEPDGWSPPPEWLGNTNGQTDGPGTEPADALDDDGSGFGVFAALGALGGVGYLLASRASNREDTDAS